MSSSANPAPSPELVALQKEFALLGDKVSKLAQTRTQLVAQLNENEGVKAELLLLDKDAELYRTLGPALIRTEAVDAKALVDARIDRIRADLKRVEEQVETAGRRRVEIRDSATKQMAPGAAAP
jgi:prefoldin beta subunit